VHGPVLAGLTEPSATLQPAIGRVGRRPKERRTADLSCRENQYRPTSKRRRRRRRRWVKITPSRAASAQSPSLTTYVRTYVLSTCCHQPPGYSSLVVFLQWK